MEVDTGAAVSLISEVAFNRNWPGKSLEQSSIKLKSYAGEAIEVKGSLQVQVEYNDQHVDHYTLLVPALSINTDTAIGRDDDKEGIIIRLYSLSSVPVSETILTGRRRLLQTFFI